MDESKDTIPEAILRWLEEHPAWFTRSEIALGIGRSKTSHFIRSIEVLVKEGHLERCTAREKGRDLFLYMTVYQYTEDLPF
jgi:hypothetical protein